MKTPISFLIRWPAILTMVALLTLFTAIPAYGQANSNPPGKMTFQGFLTDASTPPVPLGNTSPENKTVIFKIYKNAQGTASTDVLWAEQQIVTIDKGHFSVLLGEGSAVSGAPHDADLSGVFTGSDASDRWIGITVDAAEITPRIRFFPAPYAQLARRARVADAANSLVNSGGTTAVVNTQAGRLEVAGNTIVTGTTELNGNVSIGTAANSTATLKFGAGLAGQEGSAGRIGYQTFTAGALDIVGAGTGVPRKVKIWDELSVGAATIGSTATLGPTTVNGTLDANGNVVSSGGIAGLIFRNREGNLDWQWYSSGGNARLWNSGGDRVTVTSAGLVGINHGAPTHHLTINGSTGIIGGNVLEFGAGVAGKNGNAGWMGYQVFTPGALDIVGAGTAHPNRTVLIHDRLGIGVFPTAPLHVNGAGSQTIGTHANLTTAGASGTAVGSFALSDISIIGSHAIHALYFRAFSDARIKNIQGRSNGTADLETLNRIEITDYKYKDVIAKGNRSHKKVIGQQVEEVFPQAVVKSVDVIPDIYEKVPTKDGWVDLATNLKKGERVRLISETEEGIHEVLEVTPDRFRTDFIPKEDAVFIFGREVDDFRVVDYEAISMLNVSATQELAKQVAALRKSEARIAELEEKTSRLSDLEQKAARVDSLEQEVSELKKLVAQLVKAQTAPQLTAQAVQRPSGE